MNKNDFTNYLIMNDIYPSIFWENVGDEYEQVLIRIKNSCTNKDFNDIINTYV